MSAKRLSPLQLQHIAARFKALADPSRLDILQTLKGGERSVGDIRKATALGQANASKHLQVLLHAGLVLHRKEGVNKFYRLADSGVLRLCDLMCNRVAADVSHQKKLFA